MTDTPIPAEPAIPADSAPAAEAAEAADDLVIEDLSDVPWPIPTAGICICTVSAE